jgi:hypothetical protein
MRPIDRVYELVAMFIHYRQTKSAAVDLQSFSWAARLLMPSRGRVATPEKRQTGRRDEKTWAWRCGSASDSEPHCSEDGRAAPALRRVERG